MNLCTCNLLVERVVVRSIRMKCGCLDGVVENFCFKSAEVENHGTVKGSSPPRSGVSVNVKSGKLTFAALSAEATTGVS